jgi:hypothetical protein
VAASQGHVIAAVADDTLDKVIPPYLKATTLVRSNGDLPADVARHLERIATSRHPWRKRLALSAAGLLAASSIWVAFDQLSAKAAREQQDRRTHQQAYLAVTETTVQLVHERLKLTADSQTARLKFSYRVKNSGKTPAEVMSVALSFPGLPTFWKERPDRVVRPATEKYVLAPGAEETRVKHAAFDVDRHAAFSIRSQFNEPIVVNAVLIFQDVYGNERPPLQGCWQLLPAAGQDSLAIFTNDRTGGHYLRYEQHECIEKAIQLP